MLVKFITAMNHFSGNRNDLLRTKIILDYNKNRRMDKDKTYKTIFCNSLAKIQRAESAI